MTLIKIQPSFSPGSAIFKKYTQVAVLVDENTLKHCYPTVQVALPPHILIQIESGESHKNIDTCNLIWQKLTEHRFDRHALLIVLGGGVPGDMGGFCAATFKRGIDFCLIPTTLLSQVDASVGGKLGVDFGPFKNHIGVFQLPMATLISINFLKTLPHRELRSGFAEVIKHCIISDKKMWETIRERPLEQQAWLPLVKHSVAFKTSIVKKDPKEGGLRKILNFGHTLGHAVEGHFLTVGTPIFHGEAVAAGMIMESFIAARKKLLSSKELTAMNEYILSVFGKISLPESGPMLPLVLQDKKNKGNKILMALPKGIGKAIWDVPVREKEVLEAMEYYRSYQT